MRQKMFLRSGAVAMLAATSCWAASDLRLVDAVKRRDPHTVQSLLGAHINVNAAQPDGATALAVAAYLGEDRIAELLLAAGSNVNAADDYGETSLTLACANGDAPLVEKLLQAGADVKAARWDGETALMIAANAGNVQVVDQLIAHGAEVDAAESRKGQTALMWAAAEGHSDVVECLIEHGASVKAQSKSGFTTLDFAAVKNDPASIKSLLAAGADPNYALPDGTKALSIAASYHSTAAAGALLDGGADPNVKDRAGNTPLHTAAQLGDLETVKKLLAKGADANARTKKAGNRGAGGFFRPVGEQTALMLAARGDYEEIMSALIAGGADPIMTAQDGSTFLMAATGSGHVGAVKFAWQYDQNVKAVTSSGATLMHASVTGTAQGATQEAQERVCEVIRFLAEKGAPLDEKNAEGRTPIDIADVLPIDKAVDLLTALIIKSGSTPKSPSKR
jgi:ankyrin repeat protein